MLNNTTQNTMQNLFYKTQLLCLILLFFTINENSMFAQSTPYTKIPPTAYENQRLEIKRKYVKEVAAANQRNWSQLDERRLLQRTERELDEELSQQLSFHPEILKRMEQELKQAERLKTNVDIQKENLGKIGCNIDVPGWGENIGVVRFKTAETWSLGNQIWSDAVMASNCQKETYQGGGGNADCSRNPNYGDLFSWCAVVRFEKELCPSPWRVPTKEDFINLDKTLGGTGENRDGAWRSGEDKVLKYIDSWGGSYGGGGSSNPNRNTVSLSNQGSSAFYWSKTEFNTTQAFLLLFNNQDNIYPQHRHDKRNAFALRCVRDK